MKPPPVLYCLVCSLTKTIYVVLKKTIVKPYVYNGIKALGLNYIKIFVKICFLSVSEKSGFQLWNLHGKHGRLLRKPTAQHVAKESVSLSGKILPSSFNSEYSIAYTYVEIPLPKITYTGVWDPELSAVSKLHR